ncbi:hypothetical protein VcTj87_15500 [Vibrio comitans]
MALPDIVEAGEGDEDSPPPHAVRPIAADATIIVFIVFIIFLNIKLIDVIIHAPS